jgi:glycine betaine/proline transport system ATP-binding protein
MEEILRVEGLSKLFPTGSSKCGPQEALQHLKAGLSREDFKARYHWLAAVEDVSFSVRQGECLALIGLSGSGKSTLLRCLNRLQEPTAGAVFFKGEEVTAYNREELRRFRQTGAAMVFQNFGLMDHRSVLDNVCYGLEIQGLEKSQRYDRGLAMLNLVGLTGWERERVTSLSGGMKQRVGLARALACNPDLLLMDEAFSALDPLVRNDLQFELLSIQEKMNKTIIFITHDIDEAFKLGNRVGILREGRLVQLSSPEEMFSNPVDEYVRKFINNVDPSKVISIASVIEKPAALVRAAEGAHIALNSMRVNGVSSAYVVDEGMRLAGLVTLDGVLKTLNGKQSFAEGLIRDVPTTRNPENSVRSIMQLAVQAKFPIAVTDEERHLLGIVTKAAVLASLCSENREGVQQEET